MTVIDGLTRAGFFDWWGSLDDAARRAVLTEVESRYSDVVDSTPGALALRLDANLVQTPALELIDEHLVGVRDAIRVMYDRRALWARLVRDGSDPRVAIEAATDAVPSAGISRLIVSMPPQEGKSWRISRHGVLWLLRQFPTLRVAIVSYDLGNATQFSQLVRTDIELFDGSADRPDLGLRLARDDRAKSRFMLEQGGSVRAVGIGGGLTGWPVDALLIDDPIKDEADASSVLKSDRNWTWWQGVGERRLSPWGVVEVTHTRWAENDLTGRLLERERQLVAEGVEIANPWVVVNIPAEADHDPAAGETDVLGRSPGEFMISSRGRSPASWAEIKSGIDERLWEALYQGRPSPEGGTVLQKAWWRRYYEPLWRQSIDGAFVVDGWELSQSWDFAFRKTSSSDFVVGQVWASRGADDALVTCVRARLTFTETLDAVRRVTRLFPQARAKYVEARANGDAVIDALRHEIGGIIPCEPETDKVSRARAISHLVRAGNVLIPSSAVAHLAPAIAFDVDAFEAEATAFPYASHDDQVDAMTQFLRERRLERGPASIASPAGRSLRAAPSAPAAAPSTTLLERLEAVRQGA